MDRIILSAQVAQGFPSYRVGALRVDKLEPSRVDHAYIERLVADTLPGLATPQQQALWAAECAAWRDVYRRMGLKASRTLCSLESLSRRCLKGGFPRINPVVDLYNLASLRWALCLGAYDTSALHGDVEIRHARGERMVPIGGGDIELGRDHVIYADAQGPVCAYWNHRDADRSQVSAASREVLVFADAAGSGEPRVDAALAGLGEWLQAACGPGLELERPTIHTGDDRHGA